MSLAQAGRALQPNVFLLDDHPVVRAGLRMLLEHDGLHIVAEASCLAEAVGLELPAAAVDVVVADLMLKDARGVEVVTALRRSMASAAVLVLTMMDDPDEVALAQVGDTLRDPVEGDDLEPASSSPLPRTFFLPTSDV